MTVVTPGGPCLTQTQIFRDEQQARFEKKQDTKTGEAATPANPYSAAVEPPQTAGGLTGVENTDTTLQTQKSYGAPGVHLVDLSV